MLVLLGLVPDNIAVPWIEGTLAAAPAQAIVRQAADESPPEMHVRFRKNSWGYLAKQCKFALFSRDALNPPKKNDGTEICWMVTLGHKRGSVCECGARFGRR